MEGEGAQAERGAKGKVHLQMHNREGMLGMRKGAGVGLLANVRCWSGALEDMISTAKTLPRAYRYVSQARRHAWASAWCQRNGLGLS